MMIIMTPVDAKTVFTIETGKISVLICLMRTLSDVVDDSWWVARRKGRVKI